MPEIEVFEPKLKKPGLLVVDIAIKSESKVSYLSRLKYSKYGLYQIPIMHKKKEPGIDSHTPYHCSGNIHNKMTSGKLMVYPGGQTLGEAHPEIKESEVIIWERKGQPLISFSGVQEVNPEGDTIGFSDVNALCGGRPTALPGDSDFIFEINIVSLSSPMIDLKTVLVEAGNVKELQNYIEETVKKWTWPNRILAVEKAALFKHLNPWLALVVLSSS